MLACLLLGLFFRLCLDAHARTVLFCARALFIDLIDVCVWFVDKRLGFALHCFPYSCMCVVRGCARVVGGSSWGVLQLVWDLVEPGPIVELHTF